MYINPKNPKKNHKKSRFPRLRVINTVPFLSGIFLSLALLNLLLVITVFVIYGYFQITGRILPGVYVEEIKLGHLTTTEAAIEIHNNWNRDNKILVSDGIHQSYLKFEEIGINIDPIETANNAFDFGHGEDLFLDISNLFRAFFSKTSQPIVVKFNIQQGRQGLESLVPYMSLAPIDATVELRGTEFVAVDGQLGYTINIEDSLQEINNRLLDIIREKKYQVKLMPVIPRVTNVSNYITQGQAFISRPLEIKAYDPIANEAFSWLVPKETIASWTSVGTSELGPTFRLEPTEIATYLETYAENIGTDLTINGDVFASVVANAFDSNTTPTILINHKPTLYTIQPGDTLLKIGWKLGFPFWMIMKANPHINPDELISGEILTIPSKDALLPYPIIENKRIVISISKQRLWVYENGELLSKHIISTGMDRSPTQPGIFQVQTHEKSAYASVWDLTMPNFLGIYEAWPGFMNGIHGLPTLSNGRRLWENVLGKPASYGCIIMKLDAAEWLYNWAEQGVVVEIQQ